MISTVLATALNRPWTRTGAVAVLVALISLAGVRHGASPPLVRTVLLAQPPSAVAVDPRTGHAFVATVGALEPGHVSMVDTATGALLRTVPVGLDPSALAVDERAGRVVVVNHDSGSVSVLDARSGGIVNTVTVGPLPHAVAVDESSVFNVN